MLYYMLYHSVINTCCHKYDIVSAYIHIIKYANSSRLNIHCNINMYIYLSIYLYLYLNFNLYIHTPLKNLKKQVYRT